MKEENNLLKAVANSNNKVTRVDEKKLGLQMKTLYYGLKARIKGSTYETILELHIREGQLFIVKVEHTR